MTTLICWWLQKLTFGLHYLIKFIFFNNVLSDFVFMYSVCLNCLFFCFKLAYGMWWLLEWVVVPRRRKKNVSMRLCCQTKVYCSSWFWPTTALENAAWTILIDKLSIHSLIHKVSFSFVYQILLHDILMLGMYCHCG